MAGKKFYSAMASNDARTENNMVTHSTSGNACLDLFFKIGGSRAVSEDQILQWFKEAYGEDRLTALKIAFYNRDVRGGQGERRSARIILRWVAENYPEILIKNIHLIPEYGRWDDVLFIVNDTPCESAGFALCFKALEQGDKLCGKWMPRENKKGDKMAKKLMEFAGLTPREYRKLLVKNTQVVESLMCKKLWDRINYSTVPSVAFKRYSKAFGRNDGERFSSFIQKVISGDKSVKINAGAIFPHDIIREVLEAVFNGMRRSYRTTDILPIIYNILGDYSPIVAQWNALPDYFQGGGNILPVCDVSGSMSGLPMEVSISLGLYCAERNKGGFKNILCTFSDTPAFFKLSDEENIVEKVFKIGTASWAMNTNLEAVFKLILDQGVKYGLSNEEMPQTILIFSDMQFDQCTRKPNKGAYDMIKWMYKKAGYKLPQVVFWNLRTSSGVPVKFDEDGTALVSGFSPSILTNILSGNLQPEKIMEKTLAKYSEVRIK